VNGVASHPGISASGLCGSHPHSHRNRRHLGRLYLPTSPRELCSRETPGEPFGLTPVRGLWPGHTGSISDRVIGMRVFSGMTLSAGVACPNTEYRRLTGPPWDIRPRNRRRGVGRASRSTRASRRGSALQTTIIRDCLCISFGGCIAASSTIPTMSALLSSADNSANFSYSS
jgi:hypothetical protein